MDMSLHKPRDTVKDKEAWHAVVHRVTESWKWLSNWRKTTMSELYYIIEYNIDIILKIVMKALTS